MSNDYKIPNRSHKPLINTIKNDVEGEWKAYESNILDEERMPTHDGFGKYSVRAVSYAVLGIVIGLLVNAVATTFIDYVQATGTTATFVNTAIILFFMVIVMYVMEEKLPAGFSYQFQNTSAGLFFVSFFFGTQFLLMSQLTPTVG